MSADNNCINKHYLTRGFTNNLGITENELYKVLVNACFQIHKASGPGPFESFLFYELTKIRLKVDRQKDVPVIWDGLVLEKGFRADLIVEHKVIVEIKSVEEVSRLNQKQVQTYLKLTGLKLALLVNFNEVLIKDGIQRIVHNL